MAFSIHFENEVYSVSSFLQLNRNENWFMSAQQFFACWLNNSFFTFTSSGSTGKPRPFTFEKRQLEISAAATIEALGLMKDKEHLLLCLNPQFVGGAMMLARALLLDCPVTILEPKTEVFERMDKFHPYTFASFVPTQLSGQNFSAEKYTRIEKVLIGGSSLSKPLEQLLSGCSNNSYHTYGMTETLSHVALMKLNADKGYKALPKIGIRMNEENCICIKTPFLKDELVTHDLGEWIDERYFVVHGRSDFVINSGGLKINPEWLESKISLYIDSIVKTRFAVARAKHASWGEEVVLVCEQQFSEANFTDLIAQLKNEIPKNKLPKRFFVTKEISHTENGKINRKKLNEWVDSQ